MNPFDSLEEDDGLQDFAYSGESRPFDWYMTEPPATQVAKEILDSPTWQEAYGSLRLAMFIYQTRRRAYYINYMESAKRLFSIFFRKEDNLLSEKSPFWDEEEEKLWLSLRKPSSGKVDWSPNYEIQRLWLATGVHWSWLVRAWIDTEKLIWDKGTVRQQEQLDRIRPTWR